MKKLTIGPEYHDMRVDKFLRKYLSTFSLASIYKILRKKDVKVNGKRVSEQYKVQEGDEVVLYIAGEHVDASQDKTQKQMEERLRKVKPTFIVLYEDEHLLIVNKPGDIAVHGGSTVGHNTLMNQVMTYVDYRNKGYAPAPVHRLDLTTSGLVMIAKTREAVVSMNAQLKEHKVEKKYIALVKGTFEKKKGTMEAKLARTYTDDVRFKVGASYTEDKGQDAVTKYRVLYEWADAYSLLELHLITGRTHQIRAHLGLYQHPLIGDAKYGDFVENRVFKNKAKLKRQFLHAYFVSFFHPVTKEHVTVYAPLFPDLVPTLTYLDLTYAQQSNLCPDITETLGIKPTSHDGASL